MNAIYCFLGLACGGLLVMGLAYISVALWRAIMWEAGTQELEDK